jgi:ADP-heptose:LPS heptosyltransferase
MRVVALIPGGVDEQLLFFPTLDDLKQQYPEAEIDVVVEPRAKAAYRVSKSVNDVITFDFQDRISPADWANLLGVIRDRYYDAALSLQPTWSTGLLLWLTGVPNRIGYAQGGQFFLTQAIAPNPSQYAAERYHDLLQGLGISSPCPPVALSVPRSDIDWAEMERQRLGIKGGYVLMYPGSNQLLGGETPYPVESWLKIIQDFQQKQPDMPLVMLSSSGESAVITALTQAVPTLKVIKPTDLGKMAAAIAAASLVICPHSIPMHLAIALQVYTLALFGTVPASQAIPTHDKFIGLQSPSSNLADIKPEQILQKVWGA